ncbi:MAG: UDP-N-acetylmuramate--L-alanine ligase [Planctomycetes bacterium]|nr:UDP-N-acetylmuramate--L-alanine ligase [Planctomycetota bacterium]
MICSLFRGRRVHLMGIGGAGVSALVPLLQEVGAIVSGCDCSAGPVVARLRAAGVAIAMGHGPEHGLDVDLIVHTAAVPVDHPELAAARARGVPVLTRGECLVELMTGTRTIAVSGSHGKSTTTWMVGHLLTEAGLDPVVMVGGSVASLGGGARAGKSDLFVAETDESDGSFADVEPEIAIVTNLDHEHLRHYGSFSALERSFNAWLRTIPASGAAIVPTSGLGERVLDGVVARVVRCGLDAGDYHCTELDLGADGSRARISGFGVDLGEVRVTLPGAHMVHNALMAIAAVRHIAPDCDLSALARCERVRRRFTVHGSPAGVRIVEDYGHHPTEVRATIAAARLGGGRVHVVFQPHRFTRTADSFADFTAAFDQADTVVLLPIYAASEEPIAGVDARHLADAIRARRGIDPPVSHVDDEADAVAAIATRARAGDTVLILGAGDVGDLAGPFMRFFPQAGRDHGVAAGNAPVKVSEKTGEMASENASNKASKKLSDALVQEVA